MRTKYILLISVIIVIVSCKKDTGPVQKEYPDVLLNKITEISSKGVTFKATADNLSKYEILDYGFVWSESDHRPTISDIKLSLGKALKPGSFSADVNTDLAAGKKYNVRAYVQNSKYLVYSKEEVFTSLGSLAPEISSFTPAKGLDGTIVTIKGKNFSKTLSRNIVKIGSAASEVLSADENEIQIKTPLVDYSGDYKVTVKVADQTASSASFYTIIGPIISSVSPVQVRPGDLITITGHNLTINGQQTLVTISGTNADIYTADTNKVVAIVPIIRNSGGLIINIGHKVANSVSGITLLQTWFTSSSLQYGIDRSELFSINMRGYALVTRKLYEYNPDTDSWSYKTDFPGNIYSGSFKFIIGNKLYMGGGTWSDLNGQIYSKEFWCYDPQMNIWTRLNDLSNSSNNGVNPWAFSVNGLGYISYNGYLWCYNPQTNQWLQKTIMPNGLYWSGSIVINNIPYYMNGNNLWKYNVVDDQFSLKTTCPLRYSLTGGIGLNDIGYFMDNSGNTYKYNSAIDTWIPMAYYPCGGGVAVPAFVLGTKVYFGNFGGGGFQACQYTLNYMIP
jgi:hypothetical protein